jgi:hypothetical protein
MIADILTNQELGVVLELLAAEHKRILPEIHHTDSRQMRKELVSRARTVDRLIERFKEKLEEVQQP